MKKILFATIVPFWNRETGAQQRIYSMVKVLEARGHQVQVFFPGHAETLDHKRTQQLGLNVAFHRADQPVATKEPLSQRIKRQAKAVKHAVGQAVQNVANGRGDTAKRNGPLRLSDFRWPWAEAAFANTVIEFAPQAIVCEYITMAYLVESLPVELRSKVHCLVDTHDLLSHRQQEFDDHGQPHWIAVSPKEEAAAVGVFDTIVAIQENEAMAFKEMAGQNRVIVVGHQTLGADAIDSKKLNDLAVFTIGYLGSSNASNVDAVNEFLDVVWRTFQDEPRIRLVLAGNASNEVLSGFRFNNVKVLGHVGHVSDLYNQVDAVVNPVGYGTGLKIKSVEAIAYRKPLLSTSAGWTGSPVGGVTVVDQLQEMTGVISHWFADRESFERVRLAACASSHRHVDQTYRRLFDLLN